MAARDRAAMTESTGTPDAEPPGDENNPVTGDVDFVPPPPAPPNERVPQPPSHGGATDAGLGGVLVTDLAEIDAAMDRLAEAFTDAFVGAAVIPGAPSWAQVYKLMKSMVAKWAPGRLRENVNNLTIWYYGTSAISAAFCFIGICWALCHAVSKKPTAAIQKAALSLIGGEKLAYVPYIRGIPGYKAGHSGLKIGALVAVGGFEHIGICVGIGSSTFQLWSCNSTNGDSDDAITIKTYSLSAANGHVNLAYPKTAAPTTPVEETLKTLVDLGAEQPQTIKAGKRGSVAYELEYTGGDPGKIHTDKDKDGRYPSWFPKGADTPYTVTAEVILAGRPDPGVQLVVAQYKRKTNDHERDIRGQEVTGARETLTANVRMSEDHKYRIDVVNDSGRDVVVQKAYLLITH
jgi:hypothetical protein